LSVIVAALVQLTPVSPSILGKLSRATVAADYQQLYSTATMAPTSPRIERKGLQPISIAPTRGLLGIVFLGVFTILFIGCVRGISAVGAQPVGRALLTMGLLVALIALAQKASHSEALYGFWYPPKLNPDTTAPFANRNHTAGWLLMALSLSAGFLIANLASGLRNVKPTWRNRILWLSSVNATSTVLSATAIVVMAIAIVMTGSRSATACLLLVILMFSGWILRRQRSWTRRIVAISYLAVVVALSATWGHLDAVIARFENSQNDSRPAIWRDTLRIIQDSPLTGTGLNTYGIAMLHYQTVQDGNYYIEAHSDYLQLAAEGGLLLGVPALITLVLFVREVRRRFRERADDTRTYWLRVGAVTGLCAVAVQESVEFTLQMPGAVVLFVVLAAIAIHRPSQFPRESLPARIVR
jgi:O-antigen ligase